MKTIPIKTVDDFEMVCDDILSDFLESYKPRQGLIRNATKEDLDEMEYTLGRPENMKVYTDKGMKLYERYRLRLQKIAEAKFPEDEPSIKSSNIYEW